MYRLEYLFEQLKTQTIQHMYMETLNSVTESCYDLLESKSNIQKTMDDIEEETKIHKTNLLDKRRSSVVTAKKLLNKHLKVASQTKPYGLSEKCFKEFRTNDEIKQVYENAVAYLNQFNPETASEVELEAYINSVMNHSQYAEMYKSFGNGEKCPLEDMLVSAITSDKEITVTNITEAIEFLENIEDMKFDFVQTESCVLTSHNIKRQAAANFKTALLNIAEGMYYDLLTQKLVMEFTQANKIVTKAANYNPRNIKESYIKMDYIDSVFEANK